MLGVLLVFSPLAACFTLNVGPDVEFGFPGPRSCEPAVGPDHRPAGRRISDPDDTCHYVSNIPPTRLASSAPLATHNSVVSTQ